jgi:four helix bundle protein
MATSIVKEKSFAFALRAIRLARWLRERREYDLARQILRAGTSIGANVEEALAGISRRDFVMKMGIASKEAREARYWLRLLRDSETVPCQLIASMIDDADELVRILTSIVKTGQQTAEEPAT